MRLQTLSLTRRAGKKKTAVTQTEVESNSGAHFKSKAAKEKEEDSIQERLEGSLFF